jgi:hypothetical protein
MNKPIYRNNNSLKETSVNTRTDSVALHDDTHLVDLLKLIYMMVGTIDHKDPAHVLLTLRAVQGLIVLAVETAEGGAQ